MNEIEKEIEELKMELNKFIEFKIKLFEKENPGVIYTEHLGDMFSFLMNEIASLRIEIEELKNEKNFIKAANEKFQKELNQFVKQTARNIKYGGRL